ncbi:MAG: CCA tRNA nucleotidyltransferase [Hoeflea sp.]|uniref:CCA tRNA nucleotidyltransferase n=1 Tax=Hoeflea sp. TaxID=1940281 RepID=UPI001D79DD9E|nr:CCA tRNA nucleotidyltransferase [Hoeflea sp.]MBU4527260.1 CCA tRNA nucleotidyltransferase [Alphaproteobacteria bacterium]MBU4546957.1 CCA tRNA nucleotidyltransferase [Alphaproteobacteria bacterium]MBU4551531.1 CCA tRNA nucleotidyltransferase [Alphaproteobacteria bacterium]MBV1725536.1 CCA tRNA nucleotidyltransferase [Hoeflea sp.]MBV1759584.1 CCA tRNA nucleotidyltransferase [Hoeflea sp.]
MSIAASVANESWFQDPALGRIFALLNQDGGEVRVVGGAVRNALLELPVTDTDLATTWAPAEVMARAEASGIRAVPTGIDHGTVTLVIDGRGFEVTTLRHDAETDGRRAKVVFGSDWQIDAERRDFTINALYADASGAIIDLVGGLEDIASRTVRFIGEPDDRIAEDHLRILRYFRFFSHYGAGRPDAAALKACARARDSLVKLSAERVWKELKTLLKARDPGRALLWMRQAGVLSLVLPESEKWGIDSIGGLIATETALGWDPDPMLRLMAIVPPDTERMRELSVRLKLSRADSERLAQWTQAPVIAPTLAITALDRLLYRHGAGPIMDRIRLSLVSARSRTDADPAALTEAAGHSRHLARAESWARPVFPVSGSDLIAQGIKPGPAMGARLAALEERWIDSNFTLTKQKLLADPD